MGKIKLRQIILYITILFLLRAFAFSEETKTTRLNTLDWNVGLELASFRDDLIVPLGFHGPGVIVGSAFQRQQGDWQLDMSFSYKFDFLFNRFSHLGIAFSVDANPGILRTIHSHENQGNFKAGLAMPLKINNYFPFSWDDAHLYWFTIRSVAMALEWTTPPASRRNLTLHMEIPLFTQISRPPVYRHNKQDPGLAYWGFQSTEAKQQYKTVPWADYQCVWISGEYRTTTKSSWIVGFEYDHTAIPKDAWAMSTSLRYARKFRSW